VAGCYDNLSGLANRFGGLAFWRGEAVLERADAEVWGVLYRITRADLLHLDWTEGVPGRRYRHLWADAEDIDGNGLRIVTYIADGKEQDGNPSLRYIALLRAGARAHGLPEAYMRFLDSVKHAE
jgi:cation transport regulator ChaC